MARSIVGAQDAEDAVQDALPRAWQNRDRLRNERARYAWLLVILRSVAIDRVRRRLRETALMPVTFDESLGGDRPAARRFVAPDTKIELEDGIGVLPAGLRDVPALTMDGLGATEVAETTGIGRAAVRTRRSRARARMHR